MRQPVRCTWALGSALGTLRESDDSYRSPVAEVPGPWYAAPRFKSSFGRHPAWTLRSETVWDPCSPRRWLVDDTDQCPAAGALGTAGFGYTLVPPVLATTVMGGFAYPLEDAVLVILTRLGTR